MVIKMGKMLGAFAEDDGFDRSDLNQCPDCGCFFKADNCPLCGKECPEHMRAGNRPVVKQKKKRRSTSSGGRVTFISWYHTWWFIAIMLLFFPLMGAILLITSPYERWQKILFVALAVVYMIISTFGIGNIISGISDLWDKPVDTSLTRDEYVSKCESITPEQFYRSADGYEDKFVCVKLKIAESVTYIDRYYNDKDYLCYLCEDEAGSKYKIVIRDCLLEDNQRFVKGDVITVYGEGAGECEVYNSEYVYTTAPCLNMAYVVLE